MPKPPSKIAWFALAGFILAVLALVMDLTGHLTSSFILAVAAMVMVFAQLVYGYVGSRRRATPAP